MHGRLERERLGVNYESSVCEELPQYGSVQSNREKINNIKIEFGCKNLSLILLLSKLYIPLFLSDTFILLT